MSGLRTKPPRRRGCPISVRLDQSTVDEVQKLVAEIGSGATVTGFIVEAIEREVARRKRVMADLLVTEIGNDG